MASALDLIGIMSKNASRDSNELVTIMWDLEIKLGDAEENHTAFTRKDECEGAGAITAIDVHNRSRTRANGNCGTQTLEVKDAVECREDMRIVLPNIVSYTGRNEDKYVRQPRRVATYR